jgi:DNA-binding transcriptional LysR family regulator
MLQPRDLPLLAVFASVVKHGSFTAAARELSLSKSFVSDQVRMLEERCGVRLLERSTRRMRLTQVGEHVLRAAAAVGEAAREIDTILELHREAAVGTLRIATTHDLGTRLVIPVAAKLAARHAQLRLDVQSDDSLQDLISGRYDVAVRLGAPRDSAHVIRKLGFVGERIVAAPALADAFDRLRRPSDLAAAPWVRHSVAQRSDVWTFRGPRGQTDQVTPNVRGEANTGEGTRALIAAGLGFGTLPEYLMGDELRRGAIVTVLPEWINRQLTLYAVLPSRQRQPKRVALFLAALREAFSEALLGREIEAVGAPA